MKDLVRKLGTKARDISCNSFTIFQNDVLVKHKKHVDGIVVGIIELQLLQ
jgi:hypothetical protein